ncbi:transketolase [Nonomuraea diastatica]|uniref:Transketolase n=1 Tax=Nonomuraea diastatica TaxID=1848329 RepID=A0A4R4WXW9_9ACTN|nr:transketolase [Nonomuraea diastatica]TDD22600.1 transketolase [Nonomuraea diastatica]
MTIVSTTPGTLPLSETTARVREHIVGMCAGPEGGHAGGSLSLVEILATLYFRVMRVDPRFPGAPDRDVLLLSKGHGGLALYGTLCEAGFFPEEWLADYAMPDSHLMAHPHPEIPGVEMPTGSLGHGLALGIGFALAFGLDSADRRCFVVMGDGELQEGSVWEAAAVAANHRLDNLVAVVDRNRLQITGDTEQVGGAEPLAERWRAFGWQVREADGHDVDELTLALGTPPTPGRPTLVIAHTVKGKGLPFVEGHVRSHYARLSERQHQRALAALRSEREKA